MPNLGKTIPLLLAALLGISGLAEAGERHGLAGRVVGEKTPLGSAGVYAYQISDLTLHKVQTDPQGRFLFESLPAGIYQIVAHKTGFVPAIVKLHRATAEASQFVELQLVQARAASRDSRDKGAEGDFWSIRASLPRDVLREIEAAEWEEMTQASFAPGPDSLPLNGFETRVEAMAGVGQIATLGEGQVSQGRLGIGGRVGAVEVDLDGRFSQFNVAAFDPSHGPTGAGGTGSAGQTSALSLRLAAGPDSRIQVSSLTNRMTPDSQSAGAGPVDFEHYQVSWTQGVGENGRSDFAAQYTTESNYHRHGLIDPVIIPEASRTLRVEGAFTTALGDRTTLQTGARYRERRYVLSPASRAEDQPVQADLDLFGRGGVQVRPAFLVEYGLYSTLSDGSLSLTPQGGIVLQLGSDWQAKVSGSRRAYQDPEPTPDFLPTLFEANDLCEQVSESCYQVQLSRQAGEDNRLSLGAVHRTVGETVRLYFSDDFFDRLESLYLVPGDKLPEVQLGWSRRLSPTVLTSFQSSVASGGGGTFVASNRRPYENEIRYVVTSLDTQFQSTSTGVFVAFHHLSQSLAPTSGSGAAQHVADVELERLRLQVSQDLGFLMDLATDWAVQLNMELSRGTNASDSGKESELRHRFLGGLAIKF